MDKPIMNILTEWALVEGRIRGRAVLRQETAGVGRGDILVTSRVERIYLVGDTRICETMNSGYILT